MTITVLPGVDTSPSPVNVSGRYLGLVLGYLFNVRCEMKACAMWVHGYNPLSAQRKRLKITVTRTSKTPMTGI
jgi:hypothetical protein